MKSYSDELKASLIARMLPPQNVGVPELVRETGIPKDTLYGWRRSVRTRAARAPDTPLEGGLSSEERFNVVLETASLNELELGEYCRRKGLFAQQVQAWRETCRQAHVAPMSKADRQKSRDQAKAIKALEAELRRKDKALAEAAALLVLQKKVRTLWEENEAE
jgi:transposase-like protein